MFAAYFSISHELYRIGVIFMTYQTHKIVRSSMNKEQNIGELEWGLGHPYNTPIIVSFIISKDQT